MRKRILLLPMVLLLLSSCAAEDSANLEIGPVVVVGIDGGSWNAIESLWQQGELPNFRHLQETGVTAELKPVAAASPVIWTSIATGVRPERHGITNFVVPTDTGDVPVTSNVRKVPALWNMATLVGRRVAVLGWWATWPAEPVDGGVVVSDRAARRLDNSVWPPEFTAEMEPLLASVRKGDDISVTRHIGVQDRAMAAVARMLVGRDFDLLMLYLRDVDVQSHPYWKYFQPQAFSEVDPERLELYSQRVPDAYREVDRVLGDLLADADPRTNFFVLSDHGFRPKKKGQWRVVLDFDRVLARLGYLERQEGQIDWTRTRAATWDTPEAMKIKLVRFGLSGREPSGPVDPNQRQTLAERLTADLARVTYASGEPAFYVRAPRKREQERGGDLTVVVRTEAVSRRLLVDGEVIEGAIQGLHELTGTHDANTEGIFLAAGPDIDPAADLERIHTLDVAPTLLYAMGLPIAQDFDGRPQLGIFQRQFRQLHPVQTIPSWGTREVGDASVSDADAELVEELRALGYLD